MRFISIRKLVAAVQRFVFKESVCTSITDYHRATDTHTLDTERLDADMH